MTLLKDKVAIVTGAATGIGEGISQLFASHGARVFMGDRDAARLRTAVDGVNANHGAADLVLCDVAATASVNAMAETAMRQAGRIDILINNAGIYPRRTFLEMTEKDWDEMQDINLKGVYRCTKAVLPHMVDQKYGKIVNISSVTFHLGAPNLTHYVAAKGGVIGLTRSLAREVGEQTVYVNCVTPGAILVEREKEVVDEEGVKYMVAHQSLKRRLVPLDIARACLFLSSELSDGMTGQTLNVDGGWHMY